MNYDKDKFDSKISLDTKYCQNACCAHTKVVFVRLTNSYGSNSDWWQCSDCGRRFVPYEGTELILSEKKDIDIDKTLNDWLDGQTPEQLREEISKREHLPADADEKLEKIIDSNDTTSEEDWRKIIIEYSARNDKDWFQIIESFMPFHAVSKTDALKQGIKTVKKWKGERDQLKQQLDNAECEIVELHKDKSHLQNSCDMFKQQLGQRHLP